MAQCAAGLLPLVLRRDPERLWSTTAAALHVALLAYASASLQFQRSHPVPRTAGKAALSLSLARNAEVLRRRLRFLTSDAVECRALLQALLQSDPEAATRLRCGPHRFQRALRRKLLTVNRVHCGADRAGGRRSLAPWSRRSSSRVGCRLF